MTFSLTVEKRTERGTALQNLRKEGKLPAVMYGPKETAIALSLNKNSFEKIFKEAGESSVIVLTGLGDPKEVLVHDIAFDPRKGGVIHVDFYALEAGKEITVNVPLNFTGEAPALKLGGTLTKVLHEVSVTTKPATLPQHVDVDVTVLDTFDKQILIKDIVLPNGVIIENDPEDVIALVQAVAEESEMPAAPVDMSAIAVEEKGKKDVSPTP